MFTTLYQQLGVLVGEESRDYGRTEKTGKRETIDNDHALPDLYVSASTPAHAKDASSTSTEETRSIETIDKDRTDFSVSSALFGAPRDLYASLAATGASPGGPGRTELTESTETIDWDRPPDFPET